MVKISISIFLFKDSVYVTEILSMINEFRLLGIKRKYNLATHTFEFCMKHKIEGREFSYNRLPKTYQDKVLK